MCGSCSSARIVTEYHEVVAYQRDTTSQKRVHLCAQQHLQCQLGRHCHPEEYHVVYKDRWRDRLRVDSFIQRDTVTVVKEVEKPPDWWQRKKQQLGSTFLWMLVAAVAFIIILVIYNKCFRAGK